MRHRPWLASFLLLLGCAHPPPSAGAGPLLAGHPAPGALFLSGGGPESPALLAAFLNLAGGINAPLVLIPFAEGPGQQDGYRAAFTALGATSMSTLSGAAADRARDLAAIRHAAGIFIEGGDVTHLLAMASPFSQPLRLAWLSGGTVGGDSAGAMWLGAHMIVGGERPDVVSHGLAGLRLGAGTGMLAGAMVDPHFTERARFERLYTAIAAEKELGLGVDEDTAAIVAADGRLSCDGAGTVTLLTRESGGAARVRVLRAGEGVALSGWRQAIAP